jgi:polyhydroxyalkanoate synthesis regulator phasin
MLPREAAVVLECSEETVKNRIRSGRLEGRHFTNDRGENRYYADAGAVREAARERRELARVGNVAEEGEVVRENSRDLAELIMEAVKGNRETVGGELSRQRGEILEKLEAMRSERQGQYEELMELIRPLLEDQRGINELRARYLEAIEASSEREERYQETVIGLMREYNEGIKQVQRAIEGNRERLERLEAERRGS